MSFGALLVGLFLRGFVLNPKTPEALSPKSLQYLNPRKL